MLRGDFWMFPDGRVEAIAGHEHGWDAKRAMLELEPGDTFFRLPFQDWLKPLKPEEVSLFRERGVPQEQLDYLAAGKDPRAWVITNWNWIRIHNGSNFNIKRFDDLTLARIQDSKDFWRTQPKADLDDRVTVDELSTGETFTFTLKLLQRAESAEAVKHYAAGVGAFRNPEELDSETLFNSLVAGINAGESPDSLKHVWENRASVSVETLEDLCDLIDREAKNQKDMTDLDRAALALIYAQISYAVVLLSQEAETSGA